MKREVDLVVVGSGFGGSLMAIVAKRLGLSVMLLEQGRHPRMAIGESTTPLSNLLLERLSVKYDLPRLAPLAKWGSWRRAYPEVACGLKRGFTFFHEDDEPLVVAASPHDGIADTHWYRADVDHFLVNEAQRVGVEYCDDVRIESVELGSASSNIVRLAGRAGDEPLRIEAGFLIDATGPRGFLHRHLQLGECALPGMPRTEGLYCHFTGVGRSNIGGEPPFAVDDAAVHHIFDGGWVWVLRFNNGVTSAGVAATESVARELRLSDGAGAWPRVLAQLPQLQAQFARATPCESFRHLPTISFRSQTMAGPRWAMLPSAAGFVDPLLSTGFALTMLGIERLARILGGGEADLEDYAQQTDVDLLAASRLIAALYATMSNFAGFQAVLLLYFASVSFAETALRLGKPELAVGFLLHQHSEFGPRMRVLLERARSLDSVAATELFAAEVRRLIEPFDVGGFGKPALRNWYPVRAEDLLQSAFKVGAAHEEIVAMLEKGGFFESASVNR